MHQNELAFGSHPDPMWVQDRETLAFLDVNDAALALYGRQREEFLRLTLHDLLAPEDSAQDPGGSGHTGIRTHRTREGRRLQMDVRSRPVEHGGRPADLVCARDVTRLRSMEAERDELLRRERAHRQRAERSARRLQSLFEAMPGRFVVLEPGTFEIVGISDAFLESTMRDRNSVLGRPVFEAFPDDPDDPDADGVRSMQASLHRALATGRADAMGIQRYPIQRPDGRFEERYWNPVNVPVTGSRGEVAWIIHRVDDITELVQNGTIDPEAPGPTGPQVHGQLDLLLRGRAAERDNARFRAGRAQLENAQRLAGLGTWEIDPESGAGYASDATLDILGLERGAEVTGFAAFLEAVHPEDRARARKELERIRDGETALDSTLRIVHPRRGERSIRSVAQRIDTEQGPRLAGVFQDITELIRIRGEREALGQRLRRTLENLGEGFFTLDRDWRITFVNKRGEALLEAEADTLLGRVLWDSFPDATGTRFEREYQRAMHGGEAVSFDAFYQGLGRWFRVIANPTPEGIAVQFQDITVERARTDQLRLFETALEQLNDIVIITEAGPLDAPGGPRIVHVNDAFVRITGYSREEAIGATPRILQGPDTERAELDRIRRALETRQPVRAELTNRSRAGKRLSLELSIVPILDDDGHCSHFVAIERDIGIRLRTERALRLNNERFELLARATTDIIYDRDIATGRIWWNHNLTAVLGHDPEQLTAGIEPWLRRIHPDDRERVGDDLGAALAGNDQIWQSEYRLLRGDGNHARVVDRAFLIRDESGEVIRVIGSILDVTELRRLDERARQSQKLEAVGQLTGGVAHDFNNLLTVILGNAEILSEELRDPSRQGMAQVITTAAERGAELTGRLLAFARRQALAPTRIDLNRLIANMDGLLRRTLSEEIEIELDLDEDAWPVELDAGQFEMALLNLAVNARDAMPGGGRLTLATTNVRLDQQTAAPRDLEPGAHVRVTVSDSGDGISPAALDRVFEPFFTTKEVGKGSGLGLSMVYGFVKQSGGHIQIESEAGRGTRVVLWLPRSEAGEPPERAAEQDEDLPRGSEQVLVVEDDPMVRRHLSRQLELLGYRVSTAESGAEALVLIEQHGELDLLLTDVVMPGGMNGRELAERALALRPDLTLLYTSGYPEEAISRDGRLEEGVALLPKPYRRQDLALQVRAVLDARSRT